MPIIVCPLARVPHMIETRRPDRIVSLLDPETPFPDSGGVSRHLRLGMHDITEIYAGQIPPMATHVENVLQFIADWDRADPVLVHCYAGISRSTATAFTIACALNPDTDEAEIAWTLRRASPSAWPNARIVALADAALSRGGRMTAAIHAIGAGRAWHEIGEAEPFEIPSAYEAAA
ncbi:MAG: tyrosine protein phosphatase [Hydrogenophilaceae bacterium]|nr:tyrosine protein phosphatase [Hydrogenophilaceae bacterium]